VQILRRALVILFFLSGAIFAQNKTEKFTVGTASAGPGEKVNGFIEVPAGTDAGTRIPVTVIRGNKPGPVLALVSGAHGTEYTSIIALEHVIQHLEPGEISGTVIVVPLVNLESFHQKVPHVNPVDHKSMNRFYPGKLDGTQTERASYLITKEVIEKCDYLIDLHGGDLDESLRPYSYWSKTGDAKMDATTKAMVLAFGLDHIIVVTDRPRDPNASRYLESTASTRGKPAITAEAGYSGMVETDDVNALVAGCANVMRYLKMLPGEAKPIDSPVWLTKVDTISSDVDGIFYPLVKRGSYVEAGTKVGYVTDYFGKTISEKSAPVAGVVLYVCGVPSMKKGELMANIGEVGKPE
jgi:predicted deacylase